MVSVPKSTHSSPRAIRSTSTARSFGRMLRTLAVTPSLSAQWVSASCWSTHNRSGIVGTTHHRGLRTSPGALQMLSASAGRSESSDVARWSRIALSRTRSAPTSRVLPAGVTLATVLPWLVGSGEGAVATQPAARRRSTAPPRLSLVVANSQSMCDTFVEATRPAGPTKR